MYLYGSRLLGDSRADGPLSGPAATPERCKTPRPCPIVQNRATSFQQIDGVTIYNRENKPRTVSQITQELKNALTGFVRDAQALIFGPAGLKGLTMGDYNCRCISGTDQLSGHAFGRAADIYGWTYRSGSSAAIERVIYKHLVQQQAWEPLYRFGACLHLNFGQVLNWNQANHQDHFHAEVGKRSPVAFWRFIDGALSGTLAESLLNLGWRRTGGSYVPSSSSGQALVDARVAALREFVNRAAAATGDLFAKRFGRPVGQEPGDMAHLLLLAVARNGFRPSQQATPSQFPSSSAASAAQTSGGSGAGSLYQRILDAVRVGKEIIAVGLAMNAGIRDENELTNLIFFARHPDRKGRRLERSDPQFEQFSKEWIRIRDLLIRPISRQQPIRVPTAQSAPPAAAGPLPQGPFGTLKATIPGGPAFSYVFTPQDALWTARFISGEAGGRDDADNRAVIWAMFNRYALFTHRHYPTFQQFIRAYSTPLQPTLKSAGAARRHMNKPEFVRTGGNYDPPNSDVPRGQLARFLKLQATPWDKLSAGARTLAERALKGQVSNPIGLASEFGSTYVYFHDRNKRYPSDEEWRRFTEAYAGKKGWKWIGEVAGINQKKNAFFVQNKVANLPQSVVSVIPSL